jgi:hypothetical protein
MWLAEPSRVTIAPMRPGTTIALGVLLFAIFAAAVIQLVVLAR